MSSKISRNLVEDIPATSQRCGVREGLTGTWAAITVMAIGSLYVRSQLAPGARVPIHWNMAGKVDGYTSANLGVWLMPLTAAGLALLMAMLTKLEPRREHIKQSMRAIVAIWFSALLLMVVAHFAVLAAATGHAFNMTRILGITMGAMFVIIGNYMGKLRSNYFAGVRTPWTLSSELSWNKTHRLAGKLFMALGVVSAVVGLVGGGKLMLLVYSVALPVIVVYLMVYSYQVWKADPLRT